MIGDNHGEVAVKRTWYSRANRISGYLIVTFCWVMYLVFAAFPDQQDPAGLLLPFLIFFPISVLAWLFFIRPELVATDSQVVIRNLLVQTGIPWEAVRSFDGREKYLKVVTANREYVAFGTEIANISLFRSRTPNENVAAELTEILRQRKARDPGDGMIIRRPFLPGPKVLIGPALVLAAGFILYYA
ncbi:PH domain-containing protein [Pseudofrankia asymbiotica]|uniref:Low molecular weight protein antigen 6 PH domain-containing protein n=1 Tax=Pseudofrankia asymbiotica TaxID=1834516 RepID=A0A1V2I9Q0_9ACTN|nr:PH domain-containing protein [Pseudofrankia asymbiotica]ONH29500.1 hypothetical protein BL253_16670 [Pseudofrankia asymbiotica]